MDFARRTPDPPWFGEVLVDVDRAFEATGVDRPGWPDPHPDRGPSDDEYSRVTDVGKFRILDARVMAWVQVLEARRMATATDVAAVAWREPDQVDQVWRLSPRARKGLSLLLARRLVDGQPFGWDVGLADDQTQPCLLETIPPCGCDACDDGSDALLDELDGWILTVARGGVVVVESPAGRVTRMLHGWEGLPTGDLWSWFDAATPVPADATRWVGESWL